MVLVPLTAVVLVVLGGAGAWYATRQRPAAWAVVRLMGAPIVDSQRINKTGRLTVGGWLETNEVAGAMIDLGSIGHVEVDTNTRLRLVVSRSTEHRLALMRGGLYATILAPPRRFFVETPSAVAVDLGCAYTLQVDDDGASRLQVTSGWVALGLDGRESLVPAGALCQAKPGIGPGTPYFDDVSPALAEALARFDFQHGGAEALDVVLAEARPRDGPTLWHLLARVGGEDRARVYDRLAALVPPPAGVTREGVLRLDRPMLDRWREQLEYVSVGIDPKDIPTATGSLGPTGSLNGPRFAHTATLLADGRVLVTGGEQRPGVVLAGAEVYDLATGTFAETGRLSTARVGHSATRLPNGQVLLAGGSGAAFYVGGLSSAELYGPATGTCTPTGHMMTERLAHQATLLPSGKVLITGGQDSRHHKLASAELYDPASGRFSPAGNMTSPRSDHTVTLLKDGRVLICGGADAFGDRSEVVISSAELFDPATGRFTPTGGMSTVRFKHSALLLPDGQVLIIGGSDPRMVRGRHASAELFDPATGRFTPTGRMNTARYKIRDAAVLLPDGRVLVTGGGARVEIYDPATGIFGLVAGGIGAEKFYSTATLLFNGEVLMVGGYAERQRLPNASAWIYQPEKRRRGGKQQ
jgi:hypothetical protein